jgi:hypothetical protein
MAGFLQELFGDRSSQYDEYAKKQREIGNSYDPYINRGREADDFLWGQNQDLVNNPNALQDRIAGGYQQSPYQKRLLDDTTQRYNINAAHSGMIQSPLAQQALNDRMNTMTGEFMNDYIGRGMGAYGMGMNGMNNTSQRGYGAFGTKNDYLNGGAEAELNGANSAQDAWNSMIGTGAAALGGWATGGFTNLPGFMQGDFWAPSAGGLMESGGGMTSDFGGY